MLRANRRIAAVVVAAAVLALVVPALRDAAAGAVVALLVLTVGVTYVHGSRLAAWLEAQPASVSAQSVENARSCLRRLEADALRDAA